MKAVNIKCNDCGKFISMHDIESGLSRTESNPSYDQDEIPFIRFCRKCTNVIEYMTELRSRRA